MHSDRQSITPFAKSENRRQVFHFSLLTIGFLKLCKMKDLAPIFLAPIFWPQSSRNVFHMFISTSSAPILAEFLISGSPEVAINVISEADWNDGFIVG
jgi:hypothetical protein